MRPPILITGCARSGTSMVAGVIHSCGAFGGRMSGPNRYNRKGMFENSTIRQDIVKPFLKGMRVDPMGQDPLPVIERVRNLAPVVKDTWRRQVERVMEKHGHASGPWFYKGAKMCLIHPVWSAAFPDAKWVIVRRSDTDIVKSCLRTGFMRAHRSPEGWKRWVDTHKRRFAEMVEDGLQVREIWPERFFGGDLNDLRELIDWLGLIWNGDAIEDFISPALWKGGVYELKGN